MIKPLFSPFHNIEFIVSEPFGEYDDGGTHNGVDLICYNGSIPPLYSIVNGIVLSTGYSETLGNYVTIKDNKSDWAFRYAHLSNINVSTNDKIKLGTIIGIMGSTGESTGPHLHLEARHMINSNYDSNVRVDPCSYLGIKNVSYRKEPIIYYYNYNITGTNNKSHFNWAIYGNKH